MLKPKQLLLSVVFLVTFCLELFASDSNGIRKGCYYKGKYHKGNWTDGCEFNCSCLDAETGYYKCHRRCQIYRYVPTGCVLKLPAGEECCKQPDCSALDQQNGDNDENYTDTNGKDAVNSTFPGDDKKRDNGNSKGCYYKGEYHLSNWSDGCDFLCQCEDPTNGNYKCIKRCPEIPEAENGCTITPSAEDKCCMDTVCNQTDTYTTNDNNKTEYIEEIVVNHLEGPTLVVDLVNLKDPAESYSTKSITGNNTETKYEILLNQKVTKAETDTKTYETENKNGVTDKINRYSSNGSLNGQMLFNDTKFQILSTTSYSYTTFSGQTHEIVNNTDLEKGTIKKTFSNTSAIEDFNNSSTHMTRGAYIDNLKTYDLGGISENISPRMNSERNITSTTTEISGIIDERTQTNLKTNDNVTFVVHNETSNFETLFAAELRGQHILTHSSDTDRVINSTLYDNESSVQLIENTTIAGVETTVSWPNVNTEMFSNQTNTESVHYLEFSSQKINYNWSVEDENKTHDLDILLSVKNKTVTEDLHVQNLQNTDEIKGYDKTEQENGTNTFSTVILYDFLNQSLDMTEATDVVNDPGDYENRTQEIVSPSFLTTILNDSFYEPRDAESLAEKNYSVTNASRTEKLAIIFNKYGPVEFFQIRRTTPLSGLLTTTSNTTELQQTKELFNDRHYVGTDYHTNQSHEQNGTEGKCLYKGFSFPQGDKWYDGCDLVCECEDATNGVFKCRSRCKTYSVVPDGCVMRTSHVDSCCLVPECLETKEVEGIGSSSAFRTLGPAKKLMLRLKFNNRMAKRNNVFKFLPTTASQLVVMQHTTTEKYLQTVDESLQLQKMHDVGVRLQEMLETRVSMTNNEMKKSRIYDSLKLKQHFNDSEKESENNGSKVAQEVVTMSPTENNLKAPSVKDQSYIYKDNKSPFRFIKTDTGIFKVRKLDGKILKHEGATPGMLQKILHASNGKLSFSHKPPEILVTGWCTYKGRHFLEGTTWYDGCEYVCLCLPGERGKYTCHKRCPDYSHIPSGCSLMERLPGQCCKQLICS